MRGRGHLLLLVLLTGCLAAPGPEPAPAPEPGPAEQAPASDPVYLQTAPPDEEPDAPLVVTWSPEKPVAGDLLTVRIDAPYRWPEPRCLFLQLPGRELLVGGGGGESASLPAYERDGAYFCERQVLDETSAIVLSVTRGAANLTRVHGPHVIPVEADRFAERAAFEEFTLEATDDGLPLARAAVPTKLANVPWPGEPPLYGGDSTYAWFSLEVIPIDVALHLSDFAYPSWTSLQEFEATIDVPALVQRSMRDSGEDAITSSYLLLSVAHASNDLAFAVSEPQLRGYGGCADGSCFVRDG